MGEGYPPVWKKLVILGRVTPPFRIKKKFQESVDKSGKRWYNGGEAQSAEKKEGHGDAEDMGEQGKSFGGDWRDNVGAVCGDVCGEHSGAECVCVGG